MNKKKKVASSPARTSSGPVSRKSSFDPEKSRWFVPVVFVVFFLALVILFSDFLFSDKMLRGGDMIQAGIYHRAFYVAYFWEHGSVPQWDPHAFGGMPFVEAFHGDIFYPFSILKFFGNLFRMLGFVQFLHIFLAGIFMYFCARQFRLSKVASLFSAGCYMFAPYLVSYVAPGHDGKIFVTTLFPLVVLFLERGFQRRPFINFTLLGLVIGIIILSPHPQMSYFMLWVVGFYTLFKLLFLFKDTKSIVPLIKPGTLVAYAVVIGLLLSAIQFYPGYYYTTHFSPRADAKKGWTWATSWSMHEEEALSIILPEFSGTNSQKAKTYYWGKNAFKDNSEAVGITAFFLALVGLFFTHRREAYFFGSLALFALLYALADTTPVFRLFYYLIPKVSSLRAPSMIMFVFSLSIALLGGMGVQYILDKRREAAATEKKFHYLLLGVPGVMLLLALLFGVAGKGMLSAWCSVFYGEASTTMIQQNVSMLDVAFMNLPHVQSGAWFAFLSSALAAFLIWLYRSGKAGTAVLCGLVLIPVADDIRFNRRFIDTYDYQQNWPEQNPLVEFLKKDNEKFRVLTLNDPKSVMLPYYSIDVVVGYHGNQLRWYDDLLGSIELKNMGNPYFLNLVGTKYLVAPAGQSIPPNYFGDIPVKTIATLGNSQLVENNNAYPRLFLVDRYKVVPDRQNIYPQILDNSDDFRHVVYLEEEPQMTLVPDSLDTDSAWFIDYGVDTVQVGVSCGNNKILVFTDTYYDAWRVTVDGQPAMLYRAYGAFRAVEIPAGSQEVVFVFDSPRYKTGRLVTWLTTFYLFTVILIFVVRDRKNSYNEKETTP
ncbi:MAG: hypothetical protein ACOYVF_00775 [Candidatus Zixiibacteriota bacterium]